MTSLPMPTSLAGSGITPLPGLAEAAIANFGVAHDESASDGKFLLRAFRSFAEAAGSLERSYAALHAEVERLRRELEARNSDLAEARAKLRSEQALAEMSAVLAHEIRNPLGSLELFAGLLAEADLAPECRTWVERVQAGLRTLSATVNNVLHFHNHPNPQPIPVDLGQLIEWARDFFVPLARQSGVTMSLQNRASGVLIFGDRHRLEQVLLNLVLNAMHAMPGGGWVELGGRVDPNGEQVIVVVADTGPGIRGEDLPAVFEPGFTTRAGSPGLGLAVCRKIVEQHGGAITAGNRPDSGAMFTMVFPLPSKGLEVGAAKQDAAGANQ